jgi:hypothetical protein
MHLATSYNTLFTELSAAKQLHRAVSDVCSVCTLSGITYLDQNSTSFEEEGN